MAITFPLFLAKRVRAVVLVVNRFEISRKENGLNCVNISGITSVESG
jgi:hypothetical protein